MAANKKQECLDALQLRILSLDILPGSDLDESTLTQTYHISRTPLREVIHRLAGKGYVALTENKGAKVASLDLSTLRIFYQTAPLIYTSVARAACENRTGAQLDELKDVQRSFSDAMVHNRASEAAIKNHRFHELIGEMAQNPYLSASLSRLLIDHTRLSQTFYRPSSQVEEQLVQAACEQHDAMIIALEARQSALIADLTLQHWELSRDRMEKYVSPDPLPVDVLPFEDRKNAV